VGTNSALGCPLPKSEMRAVLMMVTNVLGEQALQMAFIERNDVVQEVSSTASHPPLRDANTGMRRVSGELWLDTLFGIRYT